eukprot:TRINITY_DN38718_c0_g1_i1.p1 TRINITY_DN38718_c0_g1~~TRINITY_DN38718_c0_g1_i1.p1  ORF type:complete len:209 (+),score=45.30 TRINITY_DN38718_c0_g1_i1:32-628(+)
MDSTVELKFLGEYLYEGIKGPVVVIQAMAFELSSRVFPPLRKTHLVNTVDMESASSFPCDAEFKKDMMNGMQELRKYVQSFGPAGVPLPQLAQLITSCEANPSAMAEGLLYLASTGAIAGGAIERFSEDTTTILSDYSKGASSNRASANTSFRWSSVSSILRQLPTATVINMAKAANAMRTKDSFVCNPLDPVQAFNN